MRSGRLGVFRIEENQPAHLLGVVRPGEPVGVMAMLAGTPHTAAVVALRDTEILALPREAFFEAARTEPDLMVELSRLMIHRARERAGGASEPSVFGFVSAREIHVPGPETSHANFGLLLAFSVASARELFMTLIVTFALPFEKASAKLK